MLSNHQHAAVNVVITRPVGSGRALGAALRRHGAVPLWLPALSLRAAEDVKATRTALRAGLRADVLLFTSPAAVHFAQQLQRLQVSRHTTVVALGTGTASALGRAGVPSVLVPNRQDSEGVLALEALQSINGLELAVIGAAGGRGLLQRTLTERGAKLRDVHVYRRLPARLDRRHLDPLLSAAAPIYVLVSTTRTLSLLQSMLPDAAWKRVCAAIVVASSARVAQAVRAAGCRDILRAHSANDADLLAAVLANARI